jgi:3-deoxy-manno-octulosonate cytidylyltransferase (CMP-KDO synthetase)
MGSSRFYGKPLALIGGQPMILRTLERARLASCFDRIVCATDTHEIATLAQNAGFEAVLTGECATGSDRVAQAAQNLNLPPEALIVNLQGDEPIISTELLSNITHLLSKHPEAWASAYAPLKSDEDLQNPNVVKVEVENEMAQDFWRIPNQENPLIKKIKVQTMTHRGIYAYSFHTLQAFRALPRTPLETERNIEPLRILGQTPIYMVRDNAPFVSVDTPEDILKVESIK